MRQALMTGPGKIEINEVPDPTLDKDGILMRIKTIGVCGSDIHVYHGRHPYTSYPVVQGHEFSAVVEAVGENINGVKIGMKVTACPQVVCGKCNPCLRGDYHICDFLKVEGFQTSGVAQDLFVTTQDRLVPLPEHFTFEMGALIEPVSCGVHSVGRAGDLTGKNVVVLGAGTIGNLIGQVAKAYGANVLISDINDFRLDIAHQCELKQTFNPHNESLAEAKQRVFGEKGFDVVLEAVGIEDTMNSAIENIEKGGKIVVVGVFPENPVINLGIVQDRELTLIGTLMYKHEDYKKAVELIASNKIITNPLDTNHFPFDQYQQAYRFIDKEGDKCMKVFIDM
jgi:2-desacetyl-2-hydroxyethyl bacteriochlorophyllide A dehydrogenase